MNPDAQEQIGLCVITLQSVFVPQWSGQGLTHFWIRQALSEAHSELMVHSGRHPGGEPMKLGIQEQAL